MTILLARIVRRVACCAAIVALAATSGPREARADVPVAPSPAPTASYNDAGMHFDAPAGWVALTLPPTDPTGSDQTNDPVPVAAFVHNPGKTDQAAITIKVAPFSGPVEAFDNTRTGEIRKNGDAFISKNEKIALANRMPAYFLKSNTGSEAGHYVETLEYLICDGTRSIDVAYIGNEGAFDETKARAAFDSLYVVAYPKRRP